MDNFKAVYQILRALERAMDLPQLDVTQIGAEQLGVTQERWARYIEMMSDVGYIKGVTLRRNVLGALIVDAENIWTICVRRGGIALST